MITIPIDAPSWAHRFVQDVNRELAALQAGKRPARLLPCVKASLPKAADWPYSWIFVTDEVGGATPAFSDGTNWRRAADRAVVS
jgi:hypothetical protein